MNLCMYTYENVCMYGDDKVNLRPWLAESTRRSLSEEPSPQHSPLWPLLLYIYVYVSDVCMYMYVYVSYDLCMYVYVCICNTIQIL